MFQGINQLTVLNNESIGINTRILQSYRNLIARYHYWSWLSQGIALFTNTSAQMWFLLYLDYAFLFPYFVCFGRAISWSIWLSLCKRRQNTSFSIVSLIVNLAFFLFPLHTTRGELNIFRRKTRTCKISESVTIEQMHGKWLFGTGITLQVISFLSVCQRR